MSVWLHGSLAGIGEIYNTLGIIIHAENLGTLLQSVSLIAFALYLTKSTDYDKTVFIRLFILTSPVLILMVSTPKPQLFPQVLTATALYLTIKEKVIDLKSFTLITLLLMGAAQQKLSFVLTGGVIGMWALFKTFPQNRITLITVLILIVIFFFPSGNCNMQKVAETSMKTFVTPLPDEFIKSLKEFRENRWIFPLNLFIPDALGKITTVLGIQLFLLFFIKTSNSKQFKEVVILTMIAGGMIYIFGQSISRSFYELILWLAVGLSFLPNNYFQLKVNNLILKLQGLVVLVLAIFGFALIGYGAFSSLWKEEVMHKTAYQYSAANWLNQTLPENAIVLSKLRSVSLIQRNVISADWLKFNKISRIKKHLAERNVNFYVSTSKFTGNHPLQSCLGELYAVSPSFKKATRNPFNAGNDYTVYVYNLNCSKNYGY